MNSTSKLGKDQYLFIRCNDSIRCIVKTSSGSIILNHKLQSFNVKPIAHDCGGWCHNIHTNTPAYEYAVKLTPLQAKFFAMFMTPYQEKKL